MKKLLVLGGQKKLCDIVKKAQALGYYTYVTDWYADSPAKQIADAAFDISTADVDGIVKLIVDENIDGVYTGFIDSSLEHYYEICKRADVPCYINSKILSCCTNKKQFKKYCREFGIETIPEYNVPKAGIEAVIPKIDFPVLIKPNDNSGSKGITVCSDEKSLKKAYDRAIRFSKSKSALVEKFLSCDYIAAYYIVRNGKCVLSMLMDKDMNRIGRGTVPFPTAFVSPSEYYGEYMSLMNERVCSMIESLGCENGVFQISFFVNGRHFYAVELTSRLSATREYVFVENATDIDILGEQIKFAMGENMLTGLPESLCEQMNAGIYCMLFVFIKEGIIGKIEGLDKIGNMRGVLDVLTLREEKDTVRADGSYGQLFARIYLKSQDKAEMINLVNKVQNTLSVYDENGASQIVTGFDAVRFFRDT